jgi:TPR repeat protein
MRKLTVTLCLTLTILLGSAGVSESADFQKGSIAYESEDYVTALREWTPLAEQGDAIVQYILGQMHRKGKGVPQDYKTAVKWYTLAAKQGNANAQYNLGLMYAKGHGVHLDYVYAHMWGSIAAFNGNNNGGRLRDIVVKRMTLADLSTAQKLARECVHKKYEGC